MKSSLLQIKPLYSCSCRSCRDSQAPPECRRAVITSPTPLLPPAYLAWKKINTEAFFRGHFPSISYHLALLFCACSSSPLVPSTASPRRHSAPATTPETRARGGLSPHCLTHAVLALTAQNNFLTLAFFFFTFIFLNQHPVMLLLGVFSVLHYLPQVPLCSIAAVLNFSCKRGVWAALAAATATTWGSSYYQQRRQLFWAHPSQ